MSQYYTQLFIKLTSQDWFSFVWSHAFGEIFCSIIVSYTALRTTNVIAMMLNITDSTLIAIILDMLLNFTSYTVKRVMVPGMLIKLAKL